MFTNAKTNAKFYAILTGVLGLLSALAALPPSDQTTALAAALAILPPTWRGEAAAIIHLLVVGSLYLTAHYASNAGPQTPPVDASALPGGDPLPSPPPIALPTSPRLPSNPIAATPSAPSVQ